MDLNKLKVSRFPNAKSYWTWIPNGIRLEKWKGKIYRNERLNRSADDRNIRYSYILFSLKKISSTWGNNCGVIIRDINETKAKIFHTLYTLIHSLAVARVYREADIRSKNEAGEEGGEKNGRVVEETIRGRWKRGGFVYRDSGRWGQKRRVRERAQHVFLLSRSFRSVECDPFSLTSSPRLLLVAETQAASRVHTHTHTHNPWFISLLNNSLLFSRPPLLGPQLPFDLSTPPPATSIHFYLRADALYPVLPFFFFFIPFVLLFFGPHPLGIIIDWRDTCSYLLGSSQRKNSSFDESVSIVSFFFFYFSCSIVDREIAYRWENLRIIFISEYYYVSQLGYFLEALEKF